jgi:hypothetical protein
VETFSSAPDVVDHEMLTGGRFIQSKSFNTFTAPIRQLPGRGHEAVSL